MENKRDLKGFKNTAHVISVILKVILIASVVALVGCIVGLLAINFLPKSMLQEILLSDAMVTSINLSGLSFEVSGVSLMASDIIKMFTTSLIGFAVVILFLILSLKQLIKIMTIVKNGTPFTMECAKSIRLLGILVIVSSIVVPAVSSFVEFLEIRMFNLESILLSTPGISNVTYNLFSFDGVPILIGFIILILSGVFQYGCYLQDEYDSTL